MAISLPVETLISIVKEVDDVQDLRHLRLASHTLCAIATPLAFSALSVITTSSSAKNMGRLIDLPDIAAYVKEVSYHDTGADRSGRMYDEQDVINDAIDGLASSFSRIHQLPRLETINLRFNPKYHIKMNSDGNGRLSLQPSILGALATSFNVRAPSKLTSLSLHNLRPSFPHPLETLPMQTILTRLQRLQLTPVYDRRPNSNTYHAWCYLWQKLSLCTIPAVQTQVLTELALHSNEFVGSFDGLSLHELHFPHLAVLSLRNIVFNPVKYDEVFVIRHAATLVRLELLTCKVCFGSTSLPSPAPLQYTNLAGDVEKSLRQHWDRIWDRFAAELTALVTLDVKGCHNDVESPYVQRRGWRFLIILDVDESRYAADRAALQRFQMTVTARSTETRPES